MKIIAELVFSLILVSLLSACGGSGALTLVAGSSSEASLYVFAAASLTEAFTEIGRRFEAQHPGNTIVFNFGGSQHLAQQLSDGAPGDVFASANQVQMEDLVQSGRVVAGMARIFVNNRLVIIYPNDNPARLAVPKDLAAPGVKLVLAAREVPAGRYALDFLTSTSQDPAFGDSFSDDVLANVVSYENNVKIVLAKIILGEADAGIVYASDVSGSAAGKVRQMEIPDALNILAAYPISVIRDSHNPAMAKKFVDFVLSPDGQAVLAQFGFIPVMK